MTEDRATLAAKGAEMDMSKRLDRTSIAYAGTSLPVEGGRWTTW